ncbi:MAG: hypothetical protein PHF56_00895 [Desulfuromonadaceae bacterium]|nr:hypothetical protein [Desulfuromonadaceae bacterium]
MVKLAANMLLITTCLALPLVSLAAVNSDPVIRTLRGPMPPSGVPPFVVTAALLLCTCSIIWFRRRKTVRASVVPDAPGSPVSPYALVAQLQEEARRQQCHPAEIVERLMPILRSHLAAKSGTSAEHRTSQELLAGLQRTGEADVLLQASRLLRLCDSVRFGGLAPTFDQAEWALQETLLLLQERSEKRP